jgi:hypothetical protein
MKITPPSPTTPLFSIHQCFLQTRAGRVFDFVDNHQFRIREPLVLSFGGWEKKKKPESKNRWYPENMGQKKNQCG